MIISEGCSGMSLWADAITQINLVQIHIYPFGAGLQLERVRVIKASYGTSDALTSIRETLLNRVAQYNAELLDTRDLSSQGRRSEVCFSLCCLCAEARSAQLTPLEMLGCYRWCGAGF